MSLPILLSIFCNIICSMKILFRRLVILASNYIRTLQPMTLFWWCFRAPQLRFGRSVILSSWLESNEFYWTGEKFKTLSQLSPKSILFSLRVLWFWHLNSLYITFLLICIPQVRIIPLARQRWESAGWKREYGEVPPCLIKKNNIENARV